MFPKRWLPSCYFTSVLVSSKFLQPVLEICYGAQGVNAASFDLLGNMDEVQRHKTYLMFDHLHPLVLNWDLCSEGDEWSELLLYVMEGCQVSLEFQNLPDCVAAVFKTT